MKNPHLSLFLTALLSIAALGCNDNELETTPIPEGMGSIRGRVCGPNGDIWLAEAHVFVVRTDESVNETYTDLDGRFRLTNVDAGTQTLHIEKGSFTSSQEVEVIEGQETELPEPTCLDSASAHVAVVTGDWDSIQDILADVGITDVTLYDGLNGTSPTDADLLTNLSLMSEYDIVFLNCGIYEASFFTNQTVITNLQTYVDAGGSLYASDWAYDFVEVAFPSSIDFYGDDNVRNAGAVGEDGPLTATVVDPALEEALGSTTVNLNYDLPSWVIATSAASGSRVLVKGDPSAFSWETFEMEPVPEAPLAVQFAAGAGSVIYTTFHNESQSTQDMDLLLSYMVFEL